MRYTYSQQVIHDENGPHQLANDTEVYVNQQAIHKNVSIWGPDPDDFRPSRWIDSSGEMITPEKGTFLPWSGGPRVCPGLKMAQVEFVATFATLFQAAKCESIGGGDDPRENAQRLNALMKDSFLKLSLQMKEPHKVQLRWVAQNDKPSAF